MPTNAYAQHLFRAGLTQADVESIVGDDDAANIPALATPPTERYGACAIAAFNVAVQDINDNGNLDLGTQARLEAGWSQPAAHQAQYTGTPDRVRLSLTLHIAAATAGTIVRGEPRVAVTSSGGGSRTATCYIRGNTAQDNGSVTIAWLDVAPGINPLYTFTTIQGSNEADPINTLVGECGVELEAVLV